MNKSIERESKLPNGNYEIEISPEIKNIIYQVLDQLENIELKDLKVEASPRYELANVMGVIPFAYIAPLRTRRAVPLKLKD